MSTYIKMQNIKTEELIFPREVWIDWMKVIGMLLIVFGHSSPIIMSDFVYSFSVGLFFIVAGFLTYCKSGYYKMGGVNC